MIDEAIGKILGMAMAYIASAMGMFVAYVNYRKRIVKADKIMSPAAWVVVLVTVLAIAGSVLIVAQLTEAPPESVEPAATVEVGPPPAPAPRAPAVEGERNRWPWVGIVIPAAIFLFATVVTAGLHRHFTKHGHDAPH